MAYLYEPREVIADAVIHVLGLCLASVGAVLLLAHMGGISEPHHILAVGIYCALLLFALIASAAYHLTPWPRPRDWLHKIDHAAIYFKIAGTYTPFVALIGTAFSYSVLGLIWAVAIGGAVAKLSFWRTDARGSLLLYLAMGWACLLLIIPMARTLPLMALGLIISGGLLYSTGTIFFSMPQIRFQNAIWHAFVLAASTCFFAAVTLSVTT